MPGIKTQSTYRIRKTFNGSRDEIILNTSRDLQYFNFGDHVGDDVGIILEKHFRILIESFFEIMLRRNGNHLVNHLEIVWGWCALPPL